MITVTGIFAAREEAERAAGTLAGLGIPRDRISVLAPGPAGSAAEWVGTTEAEPPGVGRVIGGVVGGAAGAAGGIQLATLIGSTVPGVGPVLAFGVLGAALLGIGGAAVGDTFDTSLREGLPRDEVFLYEDALRQGRTVLVAVVEDETASEAARRALATARAEALDAARERWWVGLRDVEAATYDAPGRGFATDEPEYRQGFEAALGIGRSRGFDDVLSELAARHPTAYRSDAFRRGFERGRRWDDAAREGRRAA
jgi:hypothetical protein